MSLSPSLTEYCEEQLAEGRMSMRKTQNTAGSEHSQGGFRGGHQIGQGRLSALPPPACDEWVVVITPQAADDASG